MHLLHTSKAIWSQNAKGCILEVLVFCPSRRFYTKYIFFLFLKWEKNYWRTLEEKRHSDNRFSGKPSNSLRCGGTKSIRKQRGCRCLLPFPGGARHGGSPDDVRGNWGARGPGAPAPGVPRHRLLTRLRPRHRGDGRARGAPAGAGAVLAARSRGGPGPEGAGDTRAEGARGTAACGPAGGPRPPGGTAASAARPRRSVLTPSAGRRPGSAASPARPGARQAPRHRARSALRGSAAKRGLRVPIGLP